MVTRPRRWLDAPDEAPPGARVLLNAGGGPDRATHDRVWAALQASGGAPTDDPTRGTGAPAHTSAPGPDPMTAAGGASLGLKKLGAILALAAAAHRDLPPAPPSSRASRVEPSLEAPPRPPEPVRSRRPSPPVTTSEPSAPPSAAAPLAPARLTAAAAPSVARVVTRSAPPAEAPVVAHAPAATGADDVGLDAERELLRAAYAALEGSPTRALALATEHARRFPSGNLEHERDVVTVEALHRLGRDAEALARADAFLRAWPSSTQAPRVRALRDRVAGTSIR